MEFLILITVKSSKRKTSWNQGGGDIERCECLSGRQNGGDGKGVGSSLICHSLVRRTKQPSGGEWGKDEGGDGFFGHTCKRKRELNCSGAKSLCRKRNPNGGVDRAI